MAESWDVVIAGAGPAGSAAAAAAIQADPDARVLLLDRSAFPRDKPCGDGIAAGVLTQLGQLGIEPAELTRGFRPTRELTLITAGGRAVRGTMREPAYTIPRAEFDNRLLTAVRGLGATWRRHRVRSVTVRPDGVLLDGAIACRVLIGADGAESSVRRSLGIPANPPGSMAIAVRGYASRRPNIGIAQGLPSNRGQVLAFTARRWPAYAWEFPVDSAWANVGYGELVATAGSRAELLAALRDLLPAADLDPATVRGHRLPLSSRRPGIRSGRILLAGDAQSLIHPLTGEGIYTAVVSGALAGNAAVQRPGAGAGARYRRAMRAALGRHLRHATAAAALGRRPRLLEPVLTAAGLDGALFDDLVEFGLHAGPVTPRMVRALRPRRARTPWVENSVARA